jgi:hypothetical protein
MPAKDHTQPVNDIDRAARGAFYQVVDELGPAGLAARFAVDRRTVDRIYAGRRDVPPGLAREIAAQIETIGPDIDARHAAWLLAWADYCAARRATALD